MFVSKPFWYITAKLTWSLQLQYRVCLAGHRFQDGTRTNHEQSFSRLLDFPGRSKIKYSVKNCDDSSTGGLQRKIHFTGGLRMIIHCTDGLQSVIFCIQMVYDWGSTVKWMYCFLSDNPRCEPMRSIARYLYVTTVWVTGFFLGISRGKGWRRFLYRYSRIRTLICINGFIV